MWRTVYLYLLRSSWNSCFSTEVSKDQIFSPVEQVGACERMTFIIGVDGDQFIIRAAEGVHDVVAGFFSSAAEITAVRAGFCHHNQGGRLLSL